MYTNVNTFYTVSRVIQFPDLKRGRGKEGGQEDGCKDLHALGVLQILNANKSHICIYAELRSTVQRFTNRLVRGWENYLPALV